MDEDMEGKTHTERERERETETERETDRERIRSGLVQLSLDNNNNNNEREREREISNTRRRGELDRGPHPPAPPALGSPSFLAEGLGKDPIPHSVLRIKSDRVY